MKLYKYCSADRIDVLRGGKIRFTPPIEFNDPFELLPAIQEGIRRDSAPDFFLSQLPSEEVWRAGYERFINENPIFSVLAKELPPEHAVALSFEAARDAMLLDFPNMLSEFLDPLDAQLRKSFPPGMQQRLNKMIGILCLTERPSNLLMWGHYADCHRGFVLEFDVSHPFFDQRKSAEDLIRHVCRVRYSKQRPRLTLLDPTADPTTFFQRLASTFFLTKSVDWEYEQEWRMIMSLEEADDRKLGLFSLPPEAVTRVIAGSRMTPENKDEVERLIRSDPRWQHLKLDVAIIDMDEFRVNVPDP